MKARKNGLVTRTVVLFGVSFLFSNAASIAVIGGLGAALFLTDQGRQVRQRVKRQL
jgi:hypothetical protein